MRCKNCCCCEHHFSAIVLAHLVHLLCLSIAVGHFVYILADEANMCGTAYAFTRNKRSFYSGAQSLQVYVHEIGHNIILGHSGSVYGGEITDSTPKADRDSRGIYGDQ